MHFEVQAGKVLVSYGVEVPVGTDLELDVEAVARKEFIEWMRLHFA